MLYIPLPVFWTLFDQSGSRWTFQANKMDGNLGWFDILPDQMQAINPLFILTLIPICEVLVYPLIAKIKINTLLRKMILGGCIAGLAFVFSAMVEAWIVNDTDHLPPKDGTHIRFYNGMSCDYDLVNSDIPGICPNFGPLDACEILNITNIKGDVQYTLDLIPSEDNQDDEFPCKALEKQKITATAGKAIGYFLATKDAKQQLIQFDDNPERAPAGTSNIRVISSFSSPHSIIVKKESYSINVSSTAEIVTYEVEKGTYEILVDDKDILKCYDDKETVKFNSGAVYNILVDEISEGVYVGILFFN